MKRGNILQDPQLSHVLREAERVFARADQLALSRGLNCTDSNVRTILLQALAALDESAPSIQHPRLSKKEQFYNEVEAMLAATFAELQSPAEESVTLQTWRTVLQAMLEHVETESPRVPRARNYLDQIRRTSG